MSSPSPNHPQGGIRRRRTALIAAGADINAKKNSGDTALTLADLYGQPEAVKLLQDAGATE
jgi:ankyrin repeat protein